MSEPQSPAKVPSGRWYRIVPVLILLYTVAYMDRYNIGFAIAGGMTNDLGVDAGFAGFAAGIFFWGYLALQFPGGHFAEKGYAKTFIAVALVVWSLLTIALGFVQTGNQLLVLRFLMGIAEGGVFPAIYTILGNWFPAKESGRASALFITNTAVASLIAGPLSGFLLSYFDWRMLFIVEGVLSLSFIFVWLPLISETPRRARWISAAELDYIEREIAADKKRTMSADNERSGRAGLFRDLNLWKLSAIYLCYHIANGAYVVWLPSLTKAITAQNIGIVGLLTTVPFMLTFVGLYLFGSLSDRSLNRKGYTMASMIGFGMCFLFAAALKNQPWIAFACLSLSGLFLKPTISLFWTMPKVIFRPEVVGGARGVINGIGNLGGFFGPTIVGYAATYAGGYDAGIYVLGVFLLIGAAITATLPAATAGAAGATPAAASYAATPATSSES